jgi:hypothetical protein
VKKVGSIVSDNYSTYFNQQDNVQERHTKRIIIQLCVSIAVGIFANDLSDDSISVLVTALSILIGFAFAAMFPIALEGVAGLPKPVYAEDRDDLRVIRKLATYFRFNVAYFIPLALVCVVILLVQMLDFSIPHSLVYLKDIIEYRTGNAWYYLALIGNSFPRVLLALSILLLQECCYTFYRMCFNALALLRIKEEYTASRPDL